MPAPWGTLESDALKEPADQAMLHERVGQAVFINLFEVRPGGSPGSDMSENCNLARGFQNVSSEF